MRNERRDWVADLGEKRNEEKLLSLQVTMVMAVWECSKEGRNSCQIRTLRKGASKGCALRSWIGWSNHESLVL